MVTMLQLALASVAVMAVVPLFLPSSKRVERSAVVKASPEALFAAMSSTEGYQIFNPYRDTDAKLRITPFGPASGLGSGFAFEGEEGKGTSTVVALEPNRSVTYQIDLGALGKPVQTIAIEAANGGTTVTWATESVFGYNPLWRVFGLFMDGLVGPVAERGLRNMDRIAAKP
jgi:uncharacterized protein YndB with AHSA1/START domain